MTEVEHVRKAYGRLTAIDDVSFQVVEGEIFSLLGLNGAGKTTTVECIQGLRMRDGGRPLLSPHAGLAHPRRSRLHPRHLCFASVAAMLGSLIPTARGARGVGVLLWFVMMMLSGAGLISLRFFRWASRKR